MQGLTKRGFELSGGDCILKFENDSGDDVGEPAVGGISTFSTPLSFLCCCSCPYVLMASFQSP